MPSVSVPDAKGPAVEVRLAAGSSDDAGTVFVRSENVPVGTALARVTFDRKRTRLPGVELCEMDRVAANARLLVSSVDKAGFEVVAGNGVPGDANFSVSYLLA